MMKTMMKSWKTTAAGIMLGVLQYAARVGGKLPETKQELWSTAIAVGLIVFGMLVKDFDVTGK